MPIQPQRFLEHIPLFAACAPEDRVWLAASSEERRFTKGQVLFRQGDACEGMHVLITGVIKLGLLRRGGAEKVVEIIQAGQSFGEAVMFLGQPYPVTAEALEDGMALYLPASALLCALERDSQLARRMLAGLSLRIRAMLTEIETMALASATERVASYLINALGEQTTGSLTLPVNKQILASRLNLSPECLSRILQKLSAEAGVTVDGRTIHVQDVNMLFGLLNPV